MSIQDSCWAKEQTAPTCKQCSRRHPRDQTSALLCTPCSFRTSLTLNTVPLIYRTNIARESRLCCTSNHIQVYTPSCVFQPTNAVFFPVISITAISDFRAAFNLTLFYVSLPYFQISVDHPCIMKIGDRALSGTCFTNH